MNTSNPIQNLESIDIVANRKDGGVDLAIVVSSVLMDTEEHQELLRRKIQNYTDHVFSESWKKEYGDAHVAIYLKAVTMPEQGIINLIAAIKKHLLDFDVDLFLEITE